MAELITTQTGHSVYSMTDIGNIQRDTNEDITHHDWLHTMGGRELLLAIVCDGVGGSTVGQLAARKTAESVVAYIEQSGTEAIPDILIGAIGYANQVVYDNGRAAGNSTASIICIDLQDNAPYGRLYTASVGDSPIYIIREPQQGEVAHLNRLDIDHNVMTESIIFRGMDPERARFLDKAEALTRAIGVGAQINADVGMYIEINGRMVPPDKAQELGQHGLPLKQGDTIFTASDGIFDQDPSSGDWFIQGSEFAEFSGDTDVERSVKELMSRATGRGPYDNVALAMVFVPSPKRRPVGGLIGGLSPRARNALIGAAAVTLLTLIGLAVLLFQSSVGQTSTRQTQQAALATRDMVQATLVQLVTEDAYTPTPSQTPTPRPTATPLPTATTRPSNIVDDQVGFQVFSRGFDLANLSTENTVRERVPLSSQARISYVTIDGGENLPQPANIYLQSDTKIEIERVENNGQFMEMLLYPSSGNIFVESGQYAVGGVSVVMADNRNIAFSSQGSCLAASYISADQVMFTCYSGQSDSDCEYRAGGESGPLAIGEQLVINIPQENVVEKRLLADDDMTTLRYYNTIEVLAGAGRGNPEAWNCIQPYLDRDLDFWINIQDRCPEDPGEVEGCEDTDGDGLVAEDDACPFVSGPASQQGCPDTDGDGVPDNLDRCPTQNGDSVDGCPLNRDGDDLPDRVDSCPEVAGPRENGGCPLPVEPVTG